MTATVTIRVALPPHLRRLAGVGDEVAVTLADDWGAPTLRRVFDALEDEHPVLKGTIRGHGAGDRRALIRFFAGGEDLSHGGLDRPLPDAVTRGAEPLHVVGAIAGG